MESLTPAQRNAHNAKLSSYAHRPLAFLFRYIRLHPLAHLVVLGSVLAAVGCALGSQYAIKHLIDVLATGRHHPGPLWSAFALLVGLIAADNLLWRVGGWVAAHTFVAVTGDLRRDLFQYLIGHSPTYYSEKQPGTLASRITATSNAVYTSENTMAWNVLPPCIAVMGAILMIVVVNPLMAAGLLGCSAVLAVVLFKLAGRGSARHHAFAAKAAAVDGELVDVIGNMGLVRAFGMTLREQKRFSETVKAEMEARQQSLLYLEKLRLLHAVITAMLSAGLLGWALWLWDRGQATSGDIVLVSSLGFTILHGTRDLAVALVDVTQHIAPLSEAVKTLLEPHGMPDRSDAVPLTAQGGRVDFERVTFAYPHRRAILDHFDLHIEPGQRVGLIGKSGAGKSTVLALLQRFYDTQGGVVKVDGQDVKTITQDSLRQAIALVPQDISLLHRTIYENIAYGRPEATREEVLAAARDARCAEFIEAMPEGYDTIVGDRGVKLSGGQRQRIAIARAILKDAPILLLDEATSALDSASEEAIQSALDRLMVGRTVIAIAHRLSTLRNFDRIIVMSNGKVIDDGPPELLRNRPGLYRDLLAKQHGRHHPIDGGTPTGERVA
ncbi:ABC transporter ATP-binding protein [Burkholderia multivorans]|uniref:ABC transporter ATP-binding protein n=1 Tax=Burkholderia multivorans TaxID=87883 RepID=UPI002018FA5E|nr:ABC transporter ATP-binding protein [Burkholderia multivorans]MCL4652345.1 ABC transporter ATP-binding protein/permease [Burkholderia multivorans]MCL4654427.1 ABC transporter ATP-binding protein/permease [Burkholderia multivorans]MCO1426853.1 ABC transporter ATP-binding protein/permease [Burkholderia multivorans]UQN82159.1 ABC transporter ATP-binding protein/permease [Burkholderia multivorans]UQO66931.1 ABC transporter ATP-binding protein/permease [Burkholderia multivorans]